MSDRVAWYRIIFRYPILVPLSPNRRYYIAAIVLLCHGLCPPLFTAVGHCPPGTIAGHVSAMQARLLKFPAETTETPAALIYAATRFARLDRSSLSAKSPQYNAHSEDPREGRPCQLKTALPRAYAACVPCHLPTACPLYPDFPVAHPPQQTEL